MKLLIQIPCYNEAETLEIALNDLPRTLQGIEEIEYLIINDGSRDNTVEVARRWGVHHVVSFKQNKGLAKGFMAGLDGRADMVTGARSIDQTAHFSLLKKKLQHFGSWVVRRASNTDIPDAPSGFRAFSRDAAMRINVVNDYTYTLETIVQAGREKMAVTSVPVRTNAELRPSRLFNSIWGYVKKSMLTILRAYMMYKPLKTFSYLLSGGVADPDGSVDRISLSVLHGSGTVRRTCTVADSGLYIDHHGLFDIYDRASRRRDRRQQETAAGYTVSCAEDGV